MKMIEKINQENLLDNVSGSMGIQLIRKMKCEKCNKKYKERLFNRCTADSQEEERRYFETQCNLSFRKSSGDVITFREVFYRCECGGFKDFVEVKDVKIE